MKLHAYQSLEIAPARWGNANTVAGIISEAAVWRDTEHRNNTEWPAPYPLELLSDPIASQSVYLGYLEDIALATITVGPATENDQKLWGQITDSDSAYYIHKLAVDMDSHERGFGEQMLDHAARVASQAGKTALRGDILYSNHRLHQYAQSQGFAFLAKQPFGRCTPQGRCTSLALYERSLS